MSPVIAQGVPGAIESVALSAVSVFPVQRFKRWVSAYFRPADIFRAESSGASLNTAAMDWAFAAFIVSVISSVAMVIVLALFGSMIGSVAGSNSGSGMLLGAGMGAAFGLVAAAFNVVFATILVPIIGLAASLVYLVIAKLLGGKGSYTSQTFIFASIGCGALLLSLPFTILGYIPYIGVAFSLVTLAISLYALLSYCRAIKVVHELSSGRAAAVVLLPVVIAIALIVALVGVAFVGFFPGVASDARATQSDTYWRYEANPFSIPEHSFSPSGSGTMVLMNNDASNTVTLSSLEVSSCDKYTGTIQLESGEQKTISLTGCPPGSSGSKYSFSVVIHYTNPSGLSITQYGMKDLVGTYE